MYRTWNGHTQIGQWLQFLKFQSVRGGITDIETEIDWDPNLHVCDGNQSPGMFEPSKNNDLCPLNNTAYLEYRNWFQSFLQNHDRYDQSWNGGCSAYLYCCFLNLSHFMLAYKIVDVYIQNYFCICHFMLVIFRILGLCMFMYIYPDGQVQALQLRKSTTIIPSFLWHTAALSFWCVARRFSNWV